MSFAKAAIKRFNEEEKDTPGPNEYDVKNIDGKGAGAGVSLALKSNRFTDKIQATPGPGQYDVLDVKKNVRRSVQVQEPFRVPKSTRSSSASRSVNSSNHTSANNSVRG